MMAGGRVLWAGLQLLDHQLVDRHGRLAGKVDDLEVDDLDGTGRLYVTAILSGPGVLSQRLGRTRIGGWIRDAHRVLTPGEGDPARIPFDKVSEISSSVVLTVDADDLGSSAGEDWVRRHVISHIPGNRHAAE
jgi:sporulation protein YlmC with PRC-barrel domain